MYAHILHMFTCVCARAHLHMDVHVMIKSKFLWTN